MSRVMDASLISLPIVDLAEGLISHHPIFVSLSITPAHQTKTFACCITISQPLLKSSWPLHLNVLQCLCHLRNKTWLSHTQRHKQTSTSLALASWSKPMPTTSMSMTPTSKHSSNTRSKYEQPTSLAWGSIHSNVDHNHEPHLRTLLGVIQPSCHQTESQPTTIMYQSEDSMRQRFTTWQTTDYHPGSYGDMPTVPS